jgi:hypothetical protein
MKGALNAGLSSQYGGRGPDASIVDCHGSTLRSVLGPKTPFEYERRSTAPASAAQNCQGARQLRADKLPRQRPAALKSKIPEPGIHLVMLIGTESVDSPYKLAFFMDNCIVCRAKTNLYLNEKPLCSVCERKIFKRPDAKPVRNKPLAEKATA